MRTADAFALVLLALTPACAELPADGVSHAAIIGGTETTEYPATVALMASNQAFRGQVFCSGTLIARRAVLTAAHCMDPSYVMFGSDPQTAGARWTRVREIVRNPSYAEGTLTGIEHDVAIVILDEDAPADVATISLAESAPAIGTTIHWVGFGYTSYGGTDKGIKRTVDREVTGTNGRLVDTGNATCRADSGGSAYITMGSQLVVAGSVRGSLSMCTGDSSFVPTAIHLAWIADTIAMHGGGATTDPDAGTSPGDAAAPGDATSSSDVTSVTPDGATPDAGTSPPPTGCHASPRAPRRTSASMLALLGVLAACAVASRRRRT